MSAIDLLYRVAHSYQGKVPALAARMGKSTTVLQNKLNPNCSTNSLTLDEAELMLDFADANLEAAEYFAEKGNAVVIRMPQVQLGDMGLLDGFMEVVKDLGILTKDFQASWADGRITKKEFKQLKKDGFQVQAQVALLLSMIEMISDEGESK